MNDVSKRGDPDDCRRNVGAVALINERLSERLEPNDFHFLRYVRCPDTGVECLGYGEVMLKVEVVPRESA